MMRGARNDRASPEERGVHRHVLAERKLRRSSRCFLRARSHVFSVVELTARQRFSALLDRAHHDDPSTNCTGAPHPRGDSPDPMTASFHHNGNVQLAPKCFNMAAERRDQVRTPATTLR
jgi:hypothetical protein